MPNQAMLYRLNNDLNPLHAAPQMAALGGFERPIMHGLCTFAVSTRAVQKKYAANDAWLISQISARFTSHVFPGETLIVSMWKESNGKVVFATKTKERGKVVCQGHLVLKQEAKL